MRSGRNSERPPKATRPNPLTTNSKRELVRIGNQSGLARPVIGSSIAGHALVGSLFGDLEFCL